MNKYLSVNVFVSHLVNNGAVPPYHALQPLRRALEPQQGDAEPVDTPDWVVLCACLWLINAGLVLYSISVSEDSPAKMLTKVHPTVAAEYATPDYFNLQRWNLWRDRAAEIGQTLEVSYPNVDGFEHFGVSRDVHNRQGFLMNFLTSAMSVFEGVENIRHLVPGAMDTRQD
jgi:hypothetical protein